MTRSCRVDSEVQRRLEILTRDNLGIARRPLYESIVRTVIPAFNRIFRTSRLPSALNKLELQFQKKVMYPRSIYKYKVFRDMLYSFETRPQVDIPYVKPDLFQNFKHPWRPSTYFKLRLDIKRNQRALNKANALPYFGKKKDNMTGNIQGWAKIQSAAKPLEAAHSIFPTFRTQQSPIEDPKVRGINMVPGEIWVGECEAYDDAIDRTIQANQSDENDIKLFYATPETISNWIKAKFPYVNQWVNVDATMYDTTVRRSELAAIVQYFAGNYQHADVLSNYLAQAAIVMPERDIVRNGGMPSGSKVTNLGDGKSNGDDHLEALDTAGYLRWFVCALINGDDLSIGFSTKFTDDQLAKWFKYSRREVSSEKSVAGEFVWNSKFYMDEEIITRPVYRFLNSAMYKEHESDPITGSKQYVAISIAQQLKDIVQHPLFADVRKLISSVDKYPLTDFSDQDLVPYVEAYVDRHSWMEDIPNTEDFLKGLKAVFE